MKNNYNTMLKKFCTEQGVDLFGVADISKIKLFDENSFHLEVES